MNRRGTVGKVDPAGVLKCPWTSEDGITVTPPTRRDVERGKPYHRIIFYDGRGKRRFASGRLQQQYRVPPDLIRELCTGELVAIHEGRWALVRVSPS